MSKYSDLKDFDPEVYGAIKDEFIREEENLELIASENHASLRVLETMGQAMSNKYAEGYPGKRYYGGCEYVDVVENLAIERAKKIFGADFVNVQPHSGTQANISVYLAELQPCDKILGMDLSHGGHLSHGSPVNFSGLYFKAFHYGVKKETGTIDFDQVRTLAKRNKPKIIVVGASAYPRIIDFQTFRDIADEVGAKLLVDIAHIAGLVAAGVHPSPVPIAEYVTTTTHKTLKGPRGGMIMGKAENEAKIKSRVFPGNQGGPLMHVIAAKAVAFKEALTDEFKVYQQQIVKNAQAMANELVNRGYNLISGGTDNHLMLIDLTNKGVTGKQAENALGAANITVNKNTVPFETRSPFDPSGIRIGTPAITSRGMKEEEMKIIAGLIDDVISNITDENIINNAKNKTLELCKNYPLYSNYIKEL